MHQSVTAFLDKVWESHEITINMPLKNIFWAIYDLYTPPPPQGISENWTQEIYLRAAIPKVGWRIYISATGASLMKVWKVLQPIFNAQPGVVAAKRTTPAAAATRVDTIVVYLLNTTAKDKLVTEMRPLFLPKPGQGRGPTIPPKLRFADFKVQVPPTTQKIAGMQGVSHAQQPLENGWAEQEKPIPKQVSFGAQLANMVARAYCGAKSKAAFVDAVKYNFLKEGININSPWQQLLTQANRDQLVMAGNTARRRRGY